MISAFDPCDDPPKLLDAGTGFRVAERENISIWYGDEESVRGQVIEVLVPERIDKD